MTTKEAMKIITDGTPGSQEWYEAVNKALEAMQKQDIMSVLLTHKAGEESALCECPTCGNRVITNYDLHRIYYSSTYCKICGQHITLPDQ